MNAITQGLTPISVRRLGALTTKLSAAGPVLGALLLARIPARAAAPALDAA